MRLMKLQLILVVPGVVDGYFGMGLSDPTSTENIRNMLKQESTNLSYVPKVTGCWSNVRLRLRIFRVRMSLWFSKDV